MADSLASEGKKVVVIIDACFAGQLRYASQGILNKHVDPLKGGIILMVSSMPSQTSAALQRYSAFARAVEEGLAGMADLDGDQKITLKELRRYTYNRVYELALERRSFPGLMVAGQDSAIDASLSIAETTPLAQGQKPKSKGSADGPFTSVPELAGDWVSGGYRLKLDSNGSFRATITQANRVVQTGDGVFKANAKCLVLDHLQASDRLEIASLSTEELRFRFQGRDVVLRRDGAAAVSGVAGTTWSGNEDLQGFGALTFQFQTGGDAIMIDAKATAKGKWSQTGNKVTVSFQNCVYEATLSGNSMSGNARLINEVRTWNFKLTRTEPPTQTPVTRLAGTTWKGTEKLAGFSDLSFQFQPEDKVVMIDAQSTVSGRWSQKGNQVTVTFANCVYTGQIQDNVFSGTARFTQGEPRDWTFSVTRQPGVDRNPGKR
jgi:hypothetical protein